MESERVFMRKKKMNVRRKVTVVIAVCVICFAALFAAAELCIRRPALILAEENARALAANTMSFAVMAALEQEQGEMLSVTRTGDESCLVTADTAKLNYVASLASADAQRRMSELGREGVDVDLGAAGGLTLFGGPRVRVGFTTVGSITAETVSSLKASGINQSIFSVELILTAHVRFVLAGRAKVVEVEGRNLICQTVIVGKVPQVYTNVANEEDMLNLVPNEIP